MNKIDKILKIQGTANAFLKSEIEKYSQYSLNGKVIFLTTLAEFTLSKGEIITIHDLQNKVDIGKVRFLETHLPFNQVLDTLLEGHRAIGLYELINTDDNVTNGMKKYHFFDSVKNRFFLYTGDFKVLYQQYYSWEEGDLPQK